MEITYEREVWKSRFGLILAVTGNAAGLGNLLRFPEQCAKYGGGAFIIPYIICFILLGLPLVWCEWCIGRYGGKYGQGNAPGIFDRLGNKPWFKYLGAIPLVCSFFICSYYLYVASWGLGYSLFSLFKTYFDCNTFSKMSEFFHSYLGIAKATSSPHNYFILAYCCFLFTFFFTFYVLYKGVVKGIERISKIFVPLLLIFGAILTIRVLSYEGITKGLAFIWEPKWGELLNPNAWLGAAGQIFFTLSVGMGSIAAYASYVGKKEDIALNGLTASSLNGFVEVIYGSTITIPIAVVIFGVAQTMDSAKFFGLGYLSMPLILSNLPLGSLFGTIWFLCLFFAGISPSLALLQPAISFLQDKLRLSRQRSVILIFSILFFLIQPSIFFIDKGYFSEVDFWAGTLGLSIGAFIEIIIFVYVFGMRKGWRELLQDADIKIPKVFFFIMKYITPVLLTIIFVVWGITMLPSVLKQSSFYIWLARIIILVALFVFLYLIHYSWKKEGRNYFSIKRRHLDRLTGILNKEGLILEKDRIEEEKISYCVAQIEILSKIEKSELKKLCKFIKKVVRAIDVVGFLDTKPPKILIIYTKTTDVQNIVIRLQNRLKQEFPDVFINLMFKYYSCEESKNIIENILK